MKARRSGGLPGKVEQNMTPMIDVVFQLLAFFVMSFKLATVEGDFNIKMPLSAPSSGTSENPFPPVRLIMKADGAGNLVSLAMGERNLGGASTAFTTLHNEILTLVGTDTGPGSMASQMEVELDCDPNLHYTNVIKAITAVSGHFDLKSQKITPLIQKVKFSSPRG